jgi:hypothetical protein
VFKHSGTPSLAALAVKDGDSYSIFGSMVVSSITSTTPGTFEIRF